MVIFDVIYNGFGIEVLDPTNIKVPRTPLPDVMNNGYTSGLLME